MTTISKLLRGYTIKTSEIPVYSEFNSEWNITIDRDICRLLLESNDPRLTPEMKSHFQKTYDLIDPYTNKLKVFYRPRQGVGRRYAEEPSKEFYTIDGQQKRNENYGKYWGSLTIHSKYIKNTIFHYLGWRDYDQRKGHPTILFEIAKRNGLHMQAYADYIKNGGFEKICSEMIAWYSVEGQAPLEEGDIKDLFNKTIYGGGHPKWVDFITQTNLTKEQKEKLIRKGKKPKKMRNKGKPHALYNKFFEDTKILTKLIWDSNVELREKVCKGMPDDSNETFSYCRNKLMSQFCGILENELTFRAYKYRVKNGLLPAKTADWGYDGFTTPPPPLDTDHQYHLDAMNKYVREKTGFTETVFVEKQFKSDTIIQEVIEARRALPPPQPTIIQENIPTKPLEIAKYIINLLPDQLMRKQKELYMFSNHRWISGNDAECALAKYLYTTIYPDLKSKLELQGGEDTKKQIGALDKYIQINSSSMIIKKVSELLPISDAIFDINPFILGFDNGVLDLKLFSNGQEPWFRKAEPKDYVSMSVGYDYFVPNKEDPMIEVRDELDTFFAAVMPKKADHKLLMQTLASCLDGIGYEKFIMMNGGGGNGKSICFNLMSEVLGGYYITAKNGVVKEVSKANESSSDVHLLKGKRMICFEELGDLDNNVMKQFTGGVRITARPLYGNPEQFYLAGTTLGTFNERPDIKNMSGGNSDHRRYVDVFWSVCFTNDEQKIGTTDIVKKQQITYQRADNKYSSVEWRTKVKIGMLWRLLHYYRESFNKQTNCIDFTVPQEALDRTADFINDQNHFHRIFHECYEVAPEKTDQVKLVDIWNEIQRHPSYLCLSVKEKRRFARKAFDEWIEKIFSIRLNNDHVKYITGLSSR